MHIQSLGILLLNLQKKFLLLILYIKFLKLFKLDI
jgi:hypothetical protein